MKPLTKTIIDEYIQKVAIIEPIEFVTYMKDYLIKKNAGLLGLMEYLRLKLPLGQESFAVMCSIIRFAMLKQKDNNEILYMVHQEIPKELVVSNDVLCYIYDQIENRLTQFIPSIMDEVSNNDEKDFMNFVMIVSKIEAGYISKIVTQFTPTFETCIMGYIPMFCVYDMYKEFLEIDFKTYIEKMKNK